MGRPILAILHRREPGKRNTTAVWKRHYSRITTALPRAVELAILAGQPGDVVEFAHAELGFQIATCKMKVGGGLDIRLSKDMHESWDEVKE